MPHPSINSRYVPLYIGGGIVVFLVFISMYLAGTGNQIALRSTVWPPVSSLLYSNNSITTGSFGSLPQDSGTQGQALVPSPEHNVAVQGEGLGVPQSQGEARYAPQRVIVKVRDQSAAVQLKAFAPGQPQQTTAPVLSVLSTYGSITSITKAYPATAASVSSNEGVRSDALGLDRVFVVNYAQVTRDPKDMARALAANPSFEYSEPDYVVQISQTNDPFFSTKGSWGQAYDDLWGLKRIESDKAWASSQGNSVLVAVIDTGIRNKHPDLFQRVWRNYKDMEGDMPDTCDRNANPSIHPADDDCNGYVDDFYGWDFANNDNNPDDGHGHGTHVAGIIGAERNNSEGIVGVAPQATLMAVKGISDDGTGYISKIVQGIKYAADNGAQISNNSWGTPIYSELLDEAFAYAKQKGMANIAAAGNDNTNSVDYPAALKSVIAVAAVTQDDTKTSFSNYGTDIDISAPGGGKYNENGGGFLDVANVLSTVDDNNGFGTTLLRVKSGYWRQAGTSQATPFVTGVAALIKSKNRTYTPDQIQAQLVASVDKIDDKNPQYQGMLGSGRVNARLAVGSADEGCRAGSSGYCIVAQLVTQAGSQCSVNLTYKIPNSAVLPAQIRQFREGHSNWDYRFAINEYGVGNKTIGPDKLRKGQTYYWIIRDRHFEQARTGLVAISSSTCSGNPTR